MLMAKIIISKTRGSLRKKLQSRTWHGLSGLFILKWKIKRKRVRGVVVLIYRGLKNKMGKDLRKNIIRALEGTENNYLEIDNSIFESKQNAYKWEMREKEIFEKLKVFLKQEGYKLKNNRKFSDLNYSINTGLFKPLIAEFNIKLPELSFIANKGYNQGYTNYGNFDYYIDIFVKNKNLDLIKQLLDDFTIENKIKVKISVI